jgi:hypothetical protein
MTDAFNRWWNAEELVEGNPYNKDTPAYWAWAGWQAGTGMKCERCGEKNPAEIHTCTPQREWQGLTEDEAQYLFRLCLGRTYDDFWRAIEAKLKEKNT